MCNNEGLYVVEDEYHFILECGVFVKLRNVYIKQDYLNVISFMKLLKSKDEEDMYNLSVFLYKALDLSLM